MQTDLEAQLPLTEPTFFILLSLRPADRHGYAIMKEVEALSAGRVALSTGTLYGALKRLCEQEWIERADDGEAPGEAGPPRKIYRLRDRGRRVLEAEIARLETLLGAARLQQMGGSV